jgi:hypothetical protein
MFVMTDGGLAKNCYACNNAGLRSEAPINVFQWNITIEL